MLTLLEKNRDAVLERLAGACAAAGRSPGEVRLVAVTKTVRPETALALAETGQLDLGENRLPSFEEKVKAFRAAGVEARWHFIGHLQRNKARRVAKLAHEIHAVDSPALLETLARVSDEEGVRPGLYLQVKLAAEESKHGLAKEEVPGVVQRARELGGPPLLGLMTMAPLIEASEDARREAARAVFRELRLLADSLPAEAFEGGRPLLSMGMSGDLEEAVAEGADLVRVGTALFQGVEGAVA